MHPFTVCFFLQGFTRSDLLNVHSEYCSVNCPEKIELQNPSEHIFQFKDFEKILGVPFIIYADFECTNKLKEVRNHITQQDLCAFAYKLVCEDHKFTKPTITYVGKDASKKFLECMIQEHEQIMTILDNVQPRFLSDEEEKRFQSAEKCCICVRIYSDDAKKNEKPLRHYNHLVGQFIGAACNSCNLYCKQNKHFLPVAFHNLRGYDSHLIMQSVGLYKDKNITCKTNNMEK